MRITIAKLSICFTLALVLLSSCASTFKQAGMALEQGDYTTAIVKSLESIEKGKDMAEAEGVLKEAWQRANAEWNAQIATIEKTTTSSELAKTIPLYNKLLEIHRIIAAAGRSNLNPTYDLIRERAMKAQQRLAEMHYKEASATLALGGRENARKAVLQYRKVKELSPEYTAIDYIIEQATKQATVKVFVLTGPDSNFSLNGIEMIPMVERKLADMEFVEVVQPPNRYAPPIGDDHNAKDFARGHGADIMVHFQPSTTWQVGMKKETRPINGSVTAAPDWKIEKLYMEALGECEVTYLVIDLTTEKTLDSGTFSVRDATDFDFSVRSILHTGGKANVQIGNMTKPEVLLKNNLAPGKTETELATQLSFFEKIELPSWGFETGISPARYGTFEPIDFNKYSTPDELTRIQDLKGHVFFNFEVIEATSVYGTETVKTYVGPYGEYLGEGFDGRIKTARFDMNVYKDLQAWMSSKKTRTAAQEAFLPKFYKETIPSKVAQEVSSAL